MPPTVVAAESDSQGCGSRKQQGCLADGAQVCAPCLSCLQNLYLPFVLSACFQPAGQACCSQRGQRRWLGGRVGTEPHLGRSL